MAHETTLSPRQSMLITLCEDLNLAWGQPHKLWFVKGETTDEWLEFAGTFEGAPENHLLDLIVAQALPTDAHGVLIACEGWDYPRHVAEAFKTDASLRAYWKTNPPSEHPERIEMRHLLLACNDGDVIALTFTREADPDVRWAMIDANTPCPVGDRAVDAARALVGLNEPLTRRLFQYEGMKVIGTISEALDKALSGEVSEEEVSRDIFLALPEPVRFQMVAEMPDDIKELLRRALTPDEQRKYGL